MKYAALSRTHADVDLDAIGRARDLFEGGERFRKAVATYLPQHDVEPPQVYKRRCAGAKDLPFREAADLPPSKPTSWPPRRACG